MKEAQLNWALAGGIPIDSLEARGGKPSWVLKRAHQRQNLFRPDWWEFIAGREHKWARALNSSECFAVNLFGPLKNDPRLAIRALGRLIPDRELRPTDVVGVAFEYLHPGANGWFGERGQATQVDVYFCIERDHRSLGHVLVEVKFTEPEFGSCRGWSDSTRRPSANDHPENCLDLAKILAAPSAKCWLAREEGRKYWEAIAAPDSTIKLGSNPTGPCPFRRGLYQIMRNRVLADSMRRHTGSEWADVAVCRHPFNRKLLDMKGDNAGIVNPIDAFHAISSLGALRDWPADNILTAIAEGEVGLSDWHDWMRYRYFRN